MSVNTSHHAFPQPNDSTIRIWRYMNLAKFISFLQTSSLYLTQLKNLAKNDPYEGTTTKKEFDKVKRGDSTAIHSQKYRVIGLATEYISCWHMNEHESEAMWKLYSSAHAEAVCIQTTYQKLASALSPVPGIADHHHFMGMVNYIDHHMDDMPSNNGFYPAMHKHKSFEHEREVRVIYWKRDPGTESPELLDEYPPGIYVPLEKINHVIENIIVSPTAPGWFLDVVRNLVDTYKVGINVSQSSLTLQPYK